MVDTSEIRMKHLIKSIDWKDLQKIAASHDEESLAKLLTNMNSDTKEYRKTSFDCRVDLLEKLRQYCEEHDEKMKHVFNTALEMFFLQEEN